MAEAPAKVAINVTVNGTATRPRSSRGMLLVNFLRETSG